MKWIIAAALWTMALVLALVIIRRVRRGHPVVLAGRWSPRVIRMVAIALVVFGGGEPVNSQEAKGAPKKLPMPENADKLPSHVNADQVRWWLQLQTPNSYSVAAKMAFVRLTTLEKPTAEDIATAKSHVKSLPASLATLVLADLQGLADGKTPPTTSVKELAVVLREFEINGYYDHYWNAYLWRKATNLDVAKEQEWSDVFAALRRNARITDVLLRAQATIKPIMISERAWGSKAGPGPEVHKAWATQTAQIVDMVKLAGEQYPTTDEGTWKRDGIIMLKADKEMPSPVLIRAGQKKDFSTEFSTRIGRLDLLKVGEKPCVLLHDSLGKIELPANTLLTVSQMTKYLSDEAKRKLDALVQDALTKNSEDAADRLETMLPLAHDAMRTGLKELPKAKGAPRLRLILTLFDDAIMPQIKVAEVAPSLGGSGFGGARPE